MTSVPDDHRGMLGQPHRQLRAPLVRRSRAAPAGARRAARTTRCPRGSRPPCGSSAPGRPRRPAPPAPTARIADQPDPDGDRIDRRRCRRNGHSGRRSSPDDDRLAGTPTRSRRAASAPTDDADRQHQGRQIPGQVVDPAGQPDRPARSPFRRRSMVSGRCRANRCGYCSLRLGRGLRGVPPIGCRATARPHPARHDAPVNSSTTTTTTATANVPSPAYCSESGTSIGLLGCQQCLDVADADPRRRRGDPGGRQDDETRRQRRAQVQRENRHDDGAEAAHRPARGPGLLGRGHHADQHEHHQRSADWPANQAVTSAS